MSLGCVGLSATPPAMPLLRSAQFPVVATVTGGWGVVIHKRPQLTDGAARGRVWVVCD